MVGFKVLFKGNWTITGDAEPDHLDTPSGKTKLCGCDSDSDSWLLVYLKG
jgi:hypothetical protein